MTRVNTLVTMMRRTVRDRAIQVRVEARERRSWHRAAARAGLTLSDLIRDTMRARLAQAVTGAEGQSPVSAPQSD